MKKRDLLAEMMQGVSKVLAHREGMNNLCQYELEKRPVSDAIAAY
ncbi:hypothetical protein [Pseudomonas sp. PDM31]|nr:hypothetical protein [Pseudomonas sp. PDM31]